MFNNQLKRNIKDLDVQISKLTKEIEELERDSSYDVTMEKLTSLTELRVQLAKSLKEDEKSDAVMEMDKQIEELTKIVANLRKDDTYSDKLAKLEELTKTRCQLEESKVKDSVKPIVTSGLLSIASVVVILKYEKTEVITSKAFGIATSMFRGNK